MALVLIVSSVAEVKRSQTHLFLPRLLSSLIKPFVDSLTWTPTCGSETTSSVSPFVNLCISLSFVDPSFRYTIIVETGVRKRNVNVNLLTFFISFRSFYFSNVIFFLGGEYFIVSRTPLRWEPLLGMAA